MARREVTRRELETPLTPYAEALEIVVSATPVLRPTRVPIEDSAGCVAASTLTAPREVPGFSNSAMDGYAVRTHDISEASPSKPVRLPIAASVLAGTLRRPRVAPGTCVEIGTGAPIPAGADAVVPFEDALKQGNYAIFRSRPKVGAHIRPANDVVKQGMTLIQKGDRLTPTRIGLLAQCGIAQVLVIPSPRATVISTGDEIVKPGSRLKMGQVFDSNSYLLSSLCESAGCNVVARSVVPDRKDALYSEIRSAARSSDLVVISGGASVGPHDWARSVAGKIRLWRVALKPGKPFGFASGPGGTPVLVLPGNPGSAFVAFAAFGFDVIAKLSGRQGPIRMRCRLSEPIAPDKKRTIVRGVRSLQRRSAPFGEAQGTPEVRPLATMSSASMYQFKDADGLAFVPPGSRPRRAAEVLFFPWSLL
jgi:molybdopterin molybdotransferase